MSDAVTTDVEELLGPVRAAEDGPHVAAVFDYDGTLIDGFSGVAFIRARALSGNVGPLEWARIAMALVRGVRTEEEFGAFLEWSLKAYAGRSVEELVAWGEKIFAEDIAPRLRPETWRLLETHQAKGHTIVLASSATNLQMDAIGRVTNAAHVLCTRMGIEDGVVTGGVDGVGLWSERKAAAVVELAEREGFDLDKSFAYSDGDEDVPLLEAVGNPTAVNPRPELRMTAAARGWPILQGVSPGGGLTPKGVVRTAAFYGGFFGGTAVAAGVGVVQGSTRTFVDTAMGMATDVGLGLAGIDVEVVDGKAHLWSSRPCVFVFNHRSNLDGVIMMQLLREGVTAVAKQEVKNIPGFGQLFQLGGVAFIDRSNSTKAREAIAPVITKIRDEGLSLAIAPEGTRWLTPGMGPFKKGAFHIARQAGVSVVPVVINGAGTLLPRGKQVLAGGRVEVAVRPPIDVAAWAPEELADRVAEVRQDMLDTLLEWDRFQ